MNSGYDFSFHNGGGNIARQVFLESNSIIGEELTLLGINSLFREELTLLGINSLFRINSIIGKKLIVL